LYFRISQGSVATYCRCGGNLSGVYIKRIFLRITWWKNFENQSTFAEVIIKHQGAYFFGGIVVLHATNCVTDYWYDINAQRVYCLYCSRGRDEMYSLTTCATLLVMLIPHIVSEKLQPQRREALCMPAY